MITAIIAGSILLPASTLAAGPAPKERASALELATVDDDHSLSAWKVSADNRQASLRSLRKWSDLLARQQSGGQPDTLCIKGLKAVCADYGKGRLVELDQARMTTAVEKINNAVNRLSFIPDRQGFNTSDHWATPAEFAALGGGDCEDFAIYKYFLLRELGVPADSMRMVILRIEGTRLYHAVLAIDIGKATFVLDKNIPTMVRADTLRLYNPIYSFNEAAWWRHAKA
jgi:predicted transglutaminase-like cysteine proteinase